MNRRDHLGDKVMLALERNGRLGVEALAEILEEKPRAVAVACIYLHRLKRARPIDTGFLMRNRAGKKKKGILWEIGCAESIPPMPDRGGDNKGKRHDVIQVKINIDEEHLAWMEYYRGKRQQRMQQQQRARV